MKAMVYHDYGSPDNLELLEIGVPAVKDDEVLVNVYAASVNWLDWHFLIGTPFLGRIMAGLLKPKNKVLGIDLAGRIEAVGAKVTQFKLGDEVFGSTDHACFAEYVSVSEDEVQLKPTNMTFAEAAAVVAAASTALRSNSGPEMRFWQWETMVAPRRATLRGRCKAGHSFLGSP
jgi:NADPH:quinone reductase-like Zn-dependent oxidoreductase